MLDGKVVARLDPARLDSLLQGIGR
jgi:hypothetical protein